MATATSTDYLKLPGQELSPIWGLTLGVGGIIAVTAGWIGEKRLLQYGGYALAAVGLYLLAAKLWKYFHVDSAHLGEELKKEGMESGSYIGKLILTLFGASSGETGAVPPKKTK